MDKPQRLARRQERNAAAAYDGSLVPMSGSGSRKGDVETGTELIECKHTEQRGYRLTLADWARHAMAAILAGKRALWEIEYTDPDGKAPIQLVVLDRNDYLELKSRAGE